MDDELCLILILENEMDSDAYTCGTCRHGIPYDNCRACEDAYERQRLQRTMAVRKQIQGAVSEELTVNVHDSEAQISGVLLTALKHNGAKT